MARTSPSSRYERSLAPPPALSLVDVVRALATGGISAEVRDRVLAHGGTVNDPHRVSLPIGALARDFQVAGSGAYVVATDTRATVDALRPVSAAVAAGATVLSGLTANVALPKVTASATSYWQATETAAVTASAPTVSAVTLAPHQAGAYVEFSRLLALQAPDLERMLRADLLGVIAKLVDQSVLDGAGSAGAPLGILRYAGIGSESGTSIAWANVLNMRKTLRDAGGREESTTWVCDPLTAKTLGGRERASGGGSFLIDGGRCDGRPVVVSANVPASTLILADWSRVVIGFWGALDVEVNPFSSFATGGKSARVLVSFDCALVTPSALVAATSVT